MVEEKKNIQEKYDSMGGRIYELLYKEEQINKYNLILDYIKPELGSLVLDDGCGTGMLMRILSNPVVGVDISSKLLERAKRAGTEQNFKYIVQGDVEELPFRSSVFDIIFSITVLQNVENPGKTLSEINRVCKDGGKIAISIIKKAIGKNKFLTLMDGLEFDTSELVDKALKDWVLILVKV
jgi:ubiquinone/menaquinone biosynthesis C-methylase UbiE